MIKNLCNVPLKSRPFVRLYNDNAKTSLSPKVRKNHFFLAFTEAQLQVAGASGLRRERDAVCTIHRRAGHTNPEL